MAKPNASGGYIPPDPERETLIAWQAACERVGAWKRGQKCTYNRGFDQTFDENDFVTGVICRVCAWTANLVDKHDVPSPPLGDPAAVVKMIAEVSKKHDVWISQWEDGDYCVTIRLDTPCTHKELGVALAAAVNALPKEKP